MEVSFQLHTRATLLLEKEPQSRCGRCGVQKNVSPAVQPVARRHTD
jgi:hypothetical protein